MPIEVCILLSLIRYGLANEKLREQPFVELVMELKRGYSLTCRANVGWAAD